MKKIAAALLLALTITITAPTAARAAENCVGDILEPTLGGLPIEVCVDVPLVPELDPIDVPVVPPIKVPTIPVPPVVQPPSVDPGTGNPDVPPATEQPTKRNPEKVTTPKKKTERVAEKPQKVEQVAPVVKEEEHQLPPPEVRQTEFEELAFPLAFMMLLVAIGFGATQLFNFFSTKKAKQVDTMASVM